MTKKEIITELEIKGISFDKTNTVAELTKLLEDSDLIIDNVIIEDVVIEEVEDNSPLIEVEDEIKDILETETINENEVYTITEKEIVPNYSNIKLEGSSFITKDGLKFASAYLAAIHNGSLGE